MICWPLLPACALSGGTVRYKDWPDPLVFSQDIHSSMVLQTEGHTPLSSSQQLNKQTSNETSTCGFRLKLEQLNNWLKTRPGFFCCCHFSEKQHEPHMSTPSLMKDMHICGQHRLFQLILQPSVNVLYVNGVTLSTR